MSNVHKIGTSNLKDPDAALEEAKGLFKSCAVLGWNEQDELVVRVTDGFTNNQMLWLLEVVKKELIEGKFS